MPFFEQITEKIVQGTEGLAESQAPAVGTSRAVSPKQLFVKRETSVGREIGVSRQFGLFGAVWSANLVKNNNMLITDQKVGLREEGGSGSSHPLMNLRSEEFEEITPVNTASPIVLRGSEKNVPMSISEEELEMLRGGSSSSSSRTSSAALSRASKKNNMLITSLQGGLRGASGLELSLPPVASNPSGSEKAIPDRLVPLSLRSTVSPIEKGLVSSTKGSVGKEEEELNRGNIDAGILIQKEKKSKVILSLMNNEEEISEEARNLMSEMAAAKREEFEKKYDAAVKKKREEAVNKEIVRRAKEEEERVAREAEVKEEKKKLKEEVRRKKKEEGEILEKEKEIERRIIEEKLSYSIPPGRSVRLGIVESETKIIERKGEYLMPRKREVERSPEAQEIYICRGIKKGLEEYNKEKERKMEELLKEYEAVLASHDGTSELNSKGWNKLVTESKNNRYWSSNRLKEYRPYERVDKASRSIASTEELKVILSKIHFEEKVDVALQVFVGEAIKEELMELNLEGAGVDDRIKKIGGDIASKIRVMTMTERAWLLREKMTMLDLDTVKRNKEYTGKLTIKFMTLADLPNVAFITVPEWREVLPILLEKKKIICKPLEGIFIGNNLERSEDALGFTAIKEVESEKNFYKAVTKDPNKVARYAAYVSLISLCGLEGVLVGKNVINAEFKDWWTLKTKAGLSEVRANGDGVEVFGTSEGIEFKREVFVASAAAGEKDLIWVKPVWNLGKKEHRYDFFKDREPVSDFKSMLMYENGYAKIKEVDPWLDLNEHNVALWVNSYIERKDEQYLMEMYRISCGLVENAVKRRSEAWFSLSTDKGGNEGDISYNVETILNRYNSIIEVVIKDNNYWRSSEQDVECLRTEIFLDQERRYLLESIPREIGESDKKINRPLSIIKENAVDVGRREKIERLMNAYDNRVKIAEYNKALDKAAGLQEQQEKEVDDVVQSLKFPAIPEEDSEGKVQASSILREGGLLRGILVERGYATVYSSSVIGGIEVSIPYSNNEGFVGTTTVDTSPTRYPPEGGLLDDRERGIIFEKELKKAQFKERVGVVVAEMKTLLAALKKEREESLDGRLKVMEKKEKVIKKVIDCDSWEKTLKEDGLLNDRKKVPKKYGFSKFHEFAWTCGKMLISGIINRIKSIFSSHQ